MLALLLHFTFFRCFGRFSQLCCVLASTGGYFFNWVTFISVKGSFRKEAMFHHPIFPQRFWGGAKPSKLLQNTSSAGQVVFCVPVAVFQQAHSWLRTKKITGHTYLRLLFTLFRSVIKQCWDWELGLSFLAKQKHSDRLTTRFTLPDSSRVTGTPGQVLTKRSWWYMPWLLLNAGSVAVTPCPEGHHKSFIIYEEPSQSCATPC